jgi:hypothetical protein
MAPWDVLGTIAEQVAFALSVLGVVGVAWVVAGAILKKLGLKNEEKSS